MAINDPDGAGSDPTRGTGPDKATGMRPPGLDAPPHAQEGEPSGSGAADPARGGCLKLGWGCLPVLLVAAFIPAGLIF
ncbi:MAG TPA: hypothetical protein VGB57_05790 [Allosphingosinicella sp.]|jgi:hypothetical protein